MFDKVFGGPLVQLVEQNREQLIFVAKRAPKLEQEVHLKVAGVAGKPVKITAIVSVARGLEAGGFLCTARVPELAQQRELAMLKAQAGVLASGMRQEPRMPRRVEIDCSDMKTKSVDISSGGIQIEAPAEMQQGEIHKLKLMPGLDCDATVAWTENGRAGLEFCESDDATKLLLSHFASGRTFTKTKTPVFHNKLIAPPSYENLD